MLILHRGIFKIIYYTSRTHVRAKPKLIKKNLLFSLYFGGSILNSMADLVWGFQKSYGHRTLPSKWTIKNGYTVYTETPLLQRAFCQKPTFGRRLPAMEEKRYTERVQSRETCQSVYGIHKEMTWADKLRRTSAPSRPTLQRKPPVLGFPRVPLTAIPIHAERPRSEPASSTARSRKSKSVTTRTTQSTATEKSGQRYSSRHSSRHACQG